MNDEVRREVKDIFIKLFGAEIAKVVDTFDDPKRYPKEFMEECIYFLEKLIGRERALELLLPIFKKHFKKLSTFFSEEL